MKPILALSVVLTAAQLAAQSYTITTVAGNGRIAFSGNSDFATNVRLLQPQYVALDAEGNAFVSDSYYHQVFRIGLDGSIRVVAGTGTPGFSGDNRLATAAQLNGPMGLAFDVNGNLYIADNLNWRVRIVNPDGVISTFAGNGSAGFGGNDGPAAKASVQNPEGLAIDSQGALYISQPVNNVVRKVDPSGTISILAGTGAAGSTGDGKAAIDARLTNPTGLALDANGSVYFSDQNSRIRRVGSDGLISTFAGSNNTALGDGGVAISASLIFPGGLAVSPDGTVYVSDSGHSRVRAISLSSTISTVAGGGAAIEDGPATAANIPFPNGLATNAQGDLVIVSRVGRQVRRLSIADGSIATIAGIHPAAIQSDGVDATSVPLLGAWGVAVDAVGSVYLSDDFDNRIMSVAADGTILTFAGNSLFGAPAENGKAYMIGSPWGLAFDPGGNLLVSAGIGETVFRMDSNAISTRVAGGNGIASSGDGGRAVLAAIGTPVSVVADSAGNFFIADSLNHKVRRVDATGEITTYAGKGAAGFDGDDGPATSALLNGPQQLALDPDGNLYIADSNNHRIRRVSTGGVITTVAGIGVAGGAGDGDLAVLASLSSPRGLAVDSSFNLYIAEASRIRKVDSASGAISTIAGSTAGFSGDGGPANEALLRTPQQLALDSGGNLYVADRGNFRVRRLVPVVAADVSKVAGIK